MIRKRAIHPVGDSLSASVPGHTLSHARPRQLSVDWAVIPLVALLSVLPLYWFAAHWQVNQDGSLYLLTALDMITGRGYTFFDENAPLTVRGPVLPGILGALMWVVGRDVEILAWAVRLLGLANPILMYFLIKRLAGPWAGLLAAGLVAFLGYSATLVLAFNIDTVALSAVLLWAVVFLQAVDRRTSSLALVAGVLLGLAILTKETMLTALPLALAAVPLLGWSLRGAFWHYGGVLAVCAPWWVAVWLGTGKIYLVGRVPTGLLWITAGILAGLLLTLAAAWRGGVLDTSRVIKRVGATWAVWGGTLAWVALLTVLLLSTRDQHQPRFQHLAFGAYVYEQILLLTPLWFLLPAVLLYVLWKALAGHRLWGFYLALLVVQTPVLVLVLVERWIARQFILPQTLLYGALAALVAEVVWQAVRWPRRWVPQWHSSRSCCTPPGTSRAPCWPRPR